MAATVGKREGLAFAGSGMATADQTPPRSSRTSAATEVVDWYRLAPTQSPTPVQANVYGPRLAACVPPVGRGALTADQTPAFWVAMKSSSSPEADEYSPSTTHPPTAGQEIGPA